jgi:hypothetical protein
MVLFAKGGLHIEKAAFYQLHKVVVALLCSLVQGLFFLIVSVVRSWFVPYDSSFGPVWELPLVSQFYSIPAYVLAGVPCSMLIDASTYWMKFRSRFPRYVIRVILYALAGILVISLFNYVQQQGTVVGYAKPMPIAYTIGLISSHALPALLFYHMSLLVRWINKRIDVSH